MQQTKIRDFMKPTTPRDLRTIAKQHHAAALFKMLALSERFEAARALEAEADSLRNGSRRDHHADR